MKNYLKRKTAVFMGTSFLMKRCISFSSNKFKKIYNKGLSRVDHIVAISDFVKSKIIDIYNKEVIESCLKNY